MDLSKFTYSKKDLRLTPKSLVHQSITQNKENCQVYETSGVSSAYQKPEGILSTSLIFVLSGGKGFSSGID